MFERLEARILKTSLNEETKELISSLLDIMEESINHKNAMDLLKLATKYELDSLRSKVISYIAPYFDTFYSFEEILEFADQPLITELLERDDLDYDEFKIYQELRNWIIKHPGSKNVLDLVRLPLIPTRDLLINITKDHNISDERTFRALQYQLAKQLGIEGNLDFLDLNSPQFKERSPKTKKISQKPSSLDDFKTKNGFQTTKADSVLKDGTANESPYNPESSTGVELSFSPKFSSNAIFQNNLPMETPPNTPQNSAHLTLNRLRPDLSQVFEPKGHTVPSNEKAQQSFGQPNNGMDSPNDDMDAPNDDTDTPSDDTDTPSDDMHNDQQGNETINERDHLSHDAELAKKLQSEQKWDFKFSPNQLWTQSPFRNQKFKILLLGDSQTGKSSFIRKFMDKPQCLDYEPTIGADVVTLAIKTTSKNSPKDFTLEIWDVSGDENNSGLRDGYFLNCHAALVFFDLTKRSSYENVWRWKKNVTEVCEQIIPFVTVGTKSDQPEHHQVNLPPEEPNQFFMISNIQDSKDHLTETIFTTLMKTLSLDRDISIEQISYIN